MCEEAKIENKFNFSLFKSNRIVTLKSYVKIESWIWRIVTPLIRMCEEVHIVGVSGCVCEEVHIGGVSGCVRRCTSCVYQDVCEEVHIVGVSGCV